MCVYVCVCVYIHTPHMLCFSTFLCFFPLVFSAPSLSHPFLAISYLSWPSYYIYFFLSFLFLSGFSLSPISLYFFSPFSLSLFFYPSVSFSFSLFFSLPFSLFFSLSPSLFLILSIFSLSKCSLWLVSVSRVTEEVVAVAP